MAKHPCIVQRSDGTVLVRAKSSAQVHRVDGNWYFPPTCIDESLFKTSDRAYTCPHKGTCYWVDLETDRGYLNDVAWTYPEPKPEYQKIASWYGFYVDHGFYAVTECE